MKSKLVEQLTNLWVFLVPFPPETRPAMPQEERRALALAHVVHLDVFELDRVVLEVVRFPRGRTCGSWGRLLGPFNGES